MSILVKNKLEVRASNVLSVPGCEPVSSLTGTALLRDLHCKAAIIPVEDALRLIPGSRLVRTMIPAGNTTTGLFFELPSGPPPNGNECNNCGVDYYKILRENARVPDAEEAQVPAPCAGFNYTGCVITQDPLRTARDPNLRPNSNPLSNQL